MSAGPATVHFILPANVDDPAMISGGNVFDRRLCQGLTELGWRVREIPIPATSALFDDADRVDPAHTDPVHAAPADTGLARAQLARALATLPDGAIVLLDGLLASGVPDIVVPHSGRLHLAVLAHMSLHDDSTLPLTSAAGLRAREGITLRAVSAVVATSHWSAQQLIGHHGVAAGRVHVIAPGTEPTPLASGTDGATRLLCVASVTALKGHDTLVDALATLTDIRWRCYCVGSLSRDPAFVARLRELIDRRLIADRVHLAGPLAGGRLARECDAADLVVLPSRAETYGMVVAEALARGTPVLTTDVGGLPEALGHAADGTVPGIIVPAGDPAALAAALRRWFGDPGLRRRLAIAARQRRGTLRGWDHSARRMAAVLGQLDRKTG